MKLQDVLDSINKHDMVIITGDMNAKVGCDREGYEKVIGTHGMGQRNDNGKRLCDICDMNELVITGTLFTHKDKHKATWISPDRRTKNQIEHTLINKRFRNSAKDTRVYRSADIGSDHYLVCTEIQLILKRQQSKKFSRMKYNTEELEREDVLKALSITLRNRYDVLREKTPAVEDSDEVNRDFEILKKTYTETAKEVLGRPKMKKRSPG